MPSWKCHCNLLVEPHGLAGPAPSLYLWPLGHAHGPNLPSQLNLTAYHAQCYSVAVTAMRIRNSPIISAALDSLMIHDKVPLEIPADI